jgi:hypothetical protein
VYSLPQLGGTRLSVTPRALHWLKVHYKSARRSQDKIENGGKRQYKETN